MTRLRRKRLNRTRAKHVRAYRPTQPLPFGRDDPIKQTLNSGKDRYVWRESGQPFRGFGKR